MKIFNYDIISSNKLLIGNLVVVRTFDLYLRFIRSYMLDLSIAIVTFNNERTIGKCVESIVTNLNTSNLSYQLYIIDNNSSDTTLNIVQSISEDIIVLRNEKNVGFGAAHNQLLDIIASRYHLVVNPDILIVNNCMIEMCSFMDQHENENIGLLSPLIKYPDGRIQYLCKKNPTFIDLFIRLAFPQSFQKRHAYFEMRDTGYNKEFEIEYATGSFMFFRTEIFKRLQGFDERFFLYLEDADVSRRVNEISKTVFYPYNHVVHEWQRGSHKSLKLALVDVRSAAYYFRKWGFKVY